MQTWKLEHRTLNPKLFIPPLVIASLITGILAGLFRIGWFEIDLAASVARVHGALMVGSFLGTLISLERAIPLRKGVVLLVPILSGASIIFFMMGFEQMAFGLISAGSIGLMILMFYYWNKHQEIHQFILFLGAVCWFIGNAMLFMGASFFTVVPWWMAFLLLTITGERLELTRFLPVSERQRYLLMASLGIFVSGCVLPFHNWGSEAMGTGLLATGAWLLKWDIARKAIKREGIHRYIGILLLAGYVWLLAAGAMLLFLPLEGFMYDAILHSFFIGFAFSMIFAHAPVILPVIAGLKKQVWHQSLYAWGVLLHLSLVARIFGDLATNPLLRKWSGMASGVVIVLFLVNMILLMGFDRSSFKVEPGN